MLDSSLEKIGKKGEELIDYAAQKLGESLDARISLAKTEISELITSKISELRSELSTVADQQKKATIRNTTLAVASALAVGLVSLGYNSINKGTIDVYSIFRAVALAIAAGQSIWILSKYISNAINTTKIQRQVVLYIAQFTGAFKIRGLALHIAILLLAVLAWTALLIYGK